MSIFGSIPVSSATALGEFDEIEASGPVGDLEPDPAEIGSGSGLLRCDHDGDFVAAIAQFSCAHASHERLVDLDASAEASRSGRTIARRSLCIQAQAVS